ncbi:Membrane associated serine protease, rhomboid family [Nannocystis exedens]|uniref:Membrane associated serine protease, rhomboid family n=2 Tax=Nannocystis exedens TaxID=54 RepID=A0A1I1VL03_9BACT|nr:rhomboid family intramembrane serine protease [Nannocystis exedens]SFD83465.1 Membrane associated serine protease, rhomboid family [Nannocystis exedens]
MSLGAGPKEHVLSGASSFGVTLRTGTKGQAGKGGPTGQAAPPPARPARPPDLLAPHLPQETAPKTPPPDLLAPHLPPTTRPPSLRPPDLLAPHLPRQPGPDAPPAAAPLPPLSAQCPACSLHALVAVHLRRGPSGRWRQLGAREQPVSGDMTLDTCPICFGVWLDQGELDQLGDADVDPAFLKTMVGRSAGRMCPRGHGFMNEHLLPGMLRTPVDRCPRCRGLWLDGDERHALARSSTPSGQEDPKVQLAKRGVLWAAQVLTQLPIEVDNPRRGIPWVVLGLGVLLLGCYVASVLGLVYAREYALVAGEVLAAPRGGYTVLTHGLFHADWFHLLFNLYFLYVFGRNVEHVFGRRRFLLLYFGAGLFGGLLQLLLTSATATPVIGASGAIAGVCGAYLVIFPRARLLQTLPLVYVQLKIPAWIYLGAWVGFQAAMAIFSEAQQFAWFSHLGGFALGAALAPPVLRSVCREVGETVRVKSAAAIFGKVPRRRGPPIVVQPVRRSS